MKPGEALCNFKSDDIVDKTIRTNPKQPGFFLTFAWWSKRAPVINPGYETLRECGTT